MNSGRMYVTESLKFFAKRKLIEPSYTSELTFIENEQFNYEKDSYFCSLSAAYVTAFKYGISEKHLTNSIPNSIST
jgi:hypothetical protein